MPVVNTEELVTPKAPSDRREERGRFSSALNYGATFATEFAVILSQIILYKLVASWLGQTGFSEYALARRVVAFLQPVTMLGLGVALPRYLAIADGRGDRDRGSRYLWATLLCVGGFTAVVAAALILARGSFSYLLFGGRERQYLIPALALMLAGISLHAILYAFFRGKLSVGRANGLQVLNNCVVPLIVFVFFHRNAANFLWHLGAAWTLTTSVIFLGARVLDRWKNPLNETRELLGYGLQRVPGDFAFMALLGLPAIFAAHFGDIRHAGMVAFGLAIVNMIASVFAPIGIILLPKVSRALGSGDFQLVRHEIVLIRRITLLVSGAAVVVAELFGRRLIHLYLGPAYADAGSVVNILVIGALPLAFYSALRSAIDAFHYKAVNTLNLVAALALFLAGSGTAALLGSSSFLLWSFCGSLTVLALLTQREVQKALRFAGVSANMVAIREPGLPEGLA